MDVFTNQFIDNLISSKHWSEIEQLIAHRFTHVEVPLETNVDIFAHDVH